MKMGWGWRGDGELVFNGDSVVAGWWGRLHGVVCVCVPNLTELCMQNGRKDMSFVRSPFTTVYKNLSLSSQYREAEVKVSLYVQAWVKRRVWASDGVRCCL